MRPHIRIVSCAVRLHTIAPRLVATDTHRFRDAYLPPMFYASNYRFTTVSFDFRRLLTNYTCKTTTQSCLVQNKLEVITHSSTELKRVLLFDASLSDNSRRVINATKCAAKPPSKLALNRPSESCRFEYFRGDPGHAMPRCESNPKE